jgi:hypothetical protein
MAKLSKCTGYTLERGDSIQCPIRDSCHRYTDKEDDGMESWIYAPYNFVYKECHLYVKDENVKQNKSS